MQARSAVLGASAALAEPAHPSSRGSSYAHTRSGSGGSVDRRDVERHRDAACHRRSARRVHARRVATAVISKYAGSVAGAAAGVSTSG